LGQGLQIRVRGGLSQNVFNEPRVQASRFTCRLSILSPTIAKGDFWVYDDRMIHQYDGSNAFSPKLVSTNENFLHAE